MSRSYKHTPMAAICGGSAKRDKQLASRGARRAYRKALHMAIVSQEFELSLPHRRECSHNNVYTWTRDGSQHWCGLDSRDWNKYLAANVEGIDSFYFGDDRYMTWPPAWYTEMMRK